MSNDVFADREAYTRYMAALRAGRRLNRRNVGRLNDNDGNKFPDPTTPFIFKHGNGRNDDPPVAGACYTYDRRNTIKQLA